MNDLFHGKGTFTGSAFKYEGDYENGHQHGKGKYTLPEGDIYEGDFVRGKFHGNGGNCPFKLFLFL